MNKKQGVAITICMACVALLGLNILVFPKIYGVGFSPNNNLIASLIVGTVYSLVVIIWAGEEVKLDKDKGENE